MCSLDWSYWVPVCAVAGVAFCGWGFHVGGFWVDSCVGEMLGWLAWGGLSVTTIRRGPYDRYLLCMAARGVAGECRRGPGLRQTRKITCKQDSRRHSY